ncbi:MAG: hypothetical protein R2939_10870 [Kofleriaceae bacterium]
MATTPAATGAGRGATSTKRVALPARVWMPSARICRPQVLAALALAIAATRGSPPSRTPRAAPAVSTATSAVRCGCAAKKASHCASACGCERTIRSCASVAPGSASKQCSMALTTSPVITSAPSASSS